MLVSGTALRVWWVARGDGRPQSDAILVLGASQLDGTPGPVFRARLEHARELYADGIAERVITVGGSAPGDRFTEAAAGATYREERAVADGVAVDQGRDTLQSLRAAALVMREQGWDSVVLVTDPWHALRSQRMAADLGIEATSSPTRSGPSVQTRGVQARYIARETAAYLYYRAVGGSAA